MRFPGAKFMICKPEGRGRETSRVFPLPAPRMTIRPEVMYTLPSSQYSPASSWMIPSPFFAAASTAF